jgi:hypothetical protein
VVGFVLRISDFLIWQAPNQADGLHLDGNTVAPLLRQVVQMLGPEFVFGNSSRDLQQPVSQGGLSRINMRDNAKVSNVFSC